MANDLTREVYETLGDGEVAVHWTYSGFKRFLLSKQWLGEEFIDYFEQTFNVEILMLWFHETHGMIPGIAKPRETPYPHSIILLNLGNYHYEPVAYESKDRNWTLFSSQHSLIRKLRERGQERPKVVARPKEKRDVEELSTKMGKLQVDED